MSKNETFSLGWLDPRTNKVNQAGVAFFNETYGEYFLKIDEEPREKNYLLRPYALQGKSVVYRMELVIKDRNGKFLRRQTVGEGFSSTEEAANVYVDYGSKYKRLVLFRKKKEVENEK